MNPANYLENLNEKYLKLHREKEDLFWTTYMGTNSDHDKFKQAEKDYKAFVSNPSQLQEIEKIESLSREEDKESLEGWKRFFSCHSIDNEEARRIQEELIKVEGDIFSKRKDVDLKYLNEKGETVSASTLVLATNLVANEKEEVRKSSFEALRELEKWVVHSGFLDLVKLRNKFARELGYENYFDYSVDKNERMGTGALFKILDEFKNLTEDNLRKGWENLATRLGNDALKPYNLRFSIGGEVEKKLDKYMPFEKSLERWVRSFHRMGVRYRGADLTLDLFDRKGKYENGFMHGPVPCYMDKDSWVPAKINFTSNANPNQVGSGFSGLNTLFHEGGHAAHFSNIVMPSPCFSHEFPPTSMAYAETQSMFFDSLLMDPDWLFRYAQSLEGETIPEELVAELIEAKQPYASYAERSIMVVPYFERILYEMDEENLTPERVLEIARKVEKNIVGLESPRPILTIPHLLGGDSACCYHGYLLAHMAVYQTKDYFLKKEGYIVDNPNIGPELAKHYWGPGNSVAHHETLQSLTGEGFSGKYLAEHCTKTSDELLELAKKRMELPGLNNIGEEDKNQELDIDAGIKIVHGEQSIADNTISYAHMFADFESWVEKNYRA